MTGVVHDGADNVSDNAADDVDKLRLVMLFMPHESRSEWRLGAAARDVTPARPASLEGLSSSSAYSLNNDILTV